MNAVIAPPPPDHDDHEFVQMIRGDLMAVIYLDSLPPFSAHPQWRWAVTRVTGNQDNIAGQTPNRACAEFCVAHALFFVGGKHAAS